MSINIDLENLVKDLNTESNVFDSIKTSLSESKSLIENQVQSVISDSIETVKQVETEMGSIEIDLSSINLDLDSFNLLDSDMFLSLPSVSEFISAATQGLNDIIDNNLLEINLSTSIGQISINANAFGSSYDKTVQNLLDKGSVLKGVTASNLRTVPSALSAPNVSRNSVNGGIRQDTGSPSRVPDGTGSQPGRTAGTRVSCANPDPNQVPKQNIIDALNQMCEDLDIYIQITPQGGWTSRTSGTKNHPLGDAADFQIKSNGGLLYPSSSPGIYGEVIAALKQNANARGVRPGIGGYGSFIHYDESPWRQNRYPASKVGFWNSGFNVGRFV